MRKSVRVLNYDWSYFFQVVALAAIYIILYKLMDSSFDSRGVAPMLRPSTGIALAALLVGGRKLWPGVFLGILGVEVLQLNSIVASAMTAAGSALALLVISWFLSTNQRFNINLKDPFSFILLGAAALFGPWISAVVGVGALFLVGNIPDQMIGYNLLECWQADALGIMLVTPLVLVWKELPYGWFSRERIIETIACFGLAAIAGQIIFLGWFQDFFVASARGYWMFLFVIWASLRYGLHGALLVISMTAVQMLVGAVLSQGGLSLRNPPVDPNNFWIYTLLVTIIGILLATVTEKSRTIETTLRQNREFFDKISKHLPGVLYQFRLYPDGRSCFPYASEGIQDIYEVSSEQVLEDASAVFAILHPEDYEGFISSIQKSAQSLNHWKHEYRVILPKQGVRWRLGESNPERLPDGSVLSSGFITDITNRKEAEERLQRLTKLHMAIAKIDQAIVHIPKDDDLLSLVCNCAVEFGGMRLAWVGKLEEEAGLVIPLAVDGVATKYLEKINVSGDPDLAEGQGPFGLALRGGKPVIVNDFLQSGMTIPWKEKAVDSGFNSMAAFPIKRAEKRFSVLCVYHEEVDAFDQEAIELMNEMALSITFALDNYDREVARKITEEELKLAASVHEASSESIMITDAENLIIAVNPAFTQITGYESEEVIGQTSHLLRSDNHDEEVYEAMNKAIVTSGQWAGEVESQRKNGETYPQWLSVKTISSDDGLVQRRVSMFADISEKKRAEQLIWHQANFDDLTGLPNRQMFYDRMNQEIKKAQRADRPLALMFLDLDGFKEVNDNLGHDHGDALLKEVAERLLSCVRETDTVSRLGGDEFTIVLSEMANIDNTELISTRVLNALVEPFKLGEEVVYVSMSIGVTFFPEDGDSIESLLKNADQAMYVAKSKGRNQCSYFTPSMQWASQVKMQIANDLREAISDNQFWVAYQPIVELKSGHIRKAEALIRWQHPKRGLISPAEFIRVAEDTRLITNIGEWVFNEAAKQVSKWQVTKDAEFQVSVNMSPVQFRDESLAFFDQLEEVGLSGKSVIIEITEGLLMDPNKIVNSKLQQFRDAGIQIALDDFGTGYSSLSYLKKFDIDYLKIDQSFIRNLKEGSEDLALCEAIIVMAHKLGMEVVAEGIETKQQQDLLLAAGCDFGQGYLFSKPVAAKEFEKLL